LSGATSLGARTLAVFAVFAFRSAGGFSGGFVVSSVALGAGGGIGCTVGGVVDGAVF